MPRGGVHGGYFYVISGRAGALTLYGDTWRSKDGKEWECMSSKAPWGKRAYTEVAIVNDTLVLTGGQALITFYNDVWTSEDFGKV
jgi:hypothetical protein